MTRAMTLAMTMAAAMTTLGGDETDDAQRANKLTCGAVTDDGLAVLASPFAAGAVSQ